MWLRSIGQLLGRMLLGINALLSLILLLCAYSAYLSPDTFALLSCSGLAFPLFLLLNVAFLFFWLFFCRLYAMLPLLTLLACIGPIRAYLPLHPFAEEVSEDAIKVLSYNVMYFDGHTPHTPKSPNEMVRYLQDCNADIICLQEVSFNNTNAKKFLSEKVFRKALSAYPYYSFYKEKGNGWVCLSRFPILSSRMIDYKSVGNGTIAYELKVGADTLLLVNNHLESHKLSIEDRAAYRDMIVDPKEDNLKSTFRHLVGKVVDAAPIRAAQADSVAKYIREHGRNYVLVCGDFNDSPLSYAHRVISEGLNDAFIETGNGLGISYNRSGIFFRIDHIMANDNFEICSCEVDRSVKASDHYPIWCYVRKKTPV